MSTAPIIPTGSVSGSSNASEGPHTPSSPSPVSVPNAINPAADAAALAAKRKPSRRANTAERRATHNAVERQRRETLNGRFLDLAGLLPNLTQIRRPSKSAIVNSSIAHIHASRRHRALASRELRMLKVEADALRRELNEWRDRAGIPRVEEPARGEGFAVVLSGELEVLTLPPGEGLEGDMIEMDMEDDEGQDGGVYEEEQIHMQQQQQQQQIHFARLHAHAQQMQHGHAMAPSPSNSTSSASSFHAPPPPPPHHMHAAPPPHHQMPGPQRSHTHPMPPNAPPPNPRRASLHLSMPPHPGHVMIASPTQMSFENPTMGTMSTPTSVGMGMMYDGHVQNVEEKYHPALYHNQQQQQMIQQQQQGMMRGMPMGLSPDQAQYLHQVQQKRERSSSIGSGSSGSGGHSPMMGGNSPSMTHSPGAAYESGGWMLPMASPPHEGPQSVMV